MLALFTSLIQELLSDGEEPVKMLKRQQGHSRREAGEEKGEGRISDSIKLWSLAILSDCWLLRYKLVF